MGGHGFPDADLFDGWADACRRLREARETGGLTPRPAGTLRLQPDEQVYADVELTMSVFYGHDPLDTAAAAGEGAQFARVRRKMDDLERRQWRDTTDLRCVLTGDRLMYLVEGRWLALPHGALVELRGDAARYTFVLLYEAVDPFRLAGPWAPTVAVGLAWFTYGPTGLDLPALRAVAAAVDAWTADPDGGLPAPPPVDPYAHLELAEED